MSNPTDTCRTCQSSNVTRHSPNGVDIHTECADCHDEWQFNPWNEPVRIWRRGPSLMSDADLHDGVYY